MFSDKISFYFVVILLCCLDECVSTFPPFVAGPQLPFGLIDLHKFFPGVAGVPGSSKGSPELSKHPGLPNLLRSFPGLPLISGALGGATPVPNIDAILESLFLLPYEGNYTTPHLIESNKYPLEIHHVITSDGYILELHRIPPRKTGNRPKKLVFLQHGLLTSSSDWLIQGPHKSLGFILSDKGYDVWMGNARGNTYSRKHITLSSNDAQFWEFSWHEIGTFDLPAMIDYVLKVTKEKGVYYVGHSQGTTAFYVMASTRPEYNKKIKVQISLAPIAFMNHMTSPLLQAISSFEGPLEVLLGLIGLHEFLPESDFFKFLFGDVLCSKDSLSQVLCTNALFALCGFSRRQMNESLLPLVAKYAPAGASTKQLLHYAQEIKSGRFCEYDFGTSENLRIYGQITPPNYDLSMITAPVFLLYSLNDWLAGVEDVKRLCDGMFNGCKEKFQISDPKFNHLDFTYGIEAPILVYKKVLRLISQY